MKVSNWILNIMSSADAGSSQDNGPIHRAHAVADLNQSETQNAAIFSMDFLAHTLVSQTMAQHILTQCSFVVFGSIASQQNGCMGAYRVINLEQFLVRISTDKAPTPLTKFGICSFFFFFLSLSCLSFFLCLSVSPCQIHGVPVRFSWDDPCLHNNNK